MARRPLPPLNALRAFEAFGRHGRMTTAADELFVTHGAVSRQVRGLEEQLSVRLTEGPKSRLRLTEAGLKLAQALTQAFDLVDEALPQQPTDADGLRVTVQPTFAMKWLIPRLPDFVDAHPDVPVRIQETNGPVDFGSTDLAIRLGAPGTGAPPGAQVTPFMQHYQGPVMAPGLLTGPVTVERIAALPRLHTRTFLPAWAEWEGRAGVTLAPPPVDREFDHYFYMLEAAAAGLGVAMGPWAFVQRDLAVGRLVAPLGFVDGEASITALTPRGGLTRPVRLFRDWLVAQGAATPPPPTGEDV
ncbi:LysR substrate-binding domain-containing protein [Caulobacter sp. NIBR2454]|uniref:LysR substrate-binding domain-containing protein n=1 Tax=Caulobacter sp. NIBR2454 TaxID=3015996 RepID=UPI0022B70B4A|nr:LysR substrate-binding domain-containing protein [Caulobacter sp. NIBR2454]